MLSENVTGAYFPAHPRVIGREGEVRILVAVIRRVVKVCSHVGVGRKR
jgi:hypothetical protein